MYVNQMIILYTLNLYSAVCQLYLNKTGRKKNQWGTKAIISTQIKITGSGPWRYDSAGHYLYITESKLNRVAFKFVILQLFWGKIISIKPIW